MKQSFLFRIGVSVVGLLALVAIFGPLVAPHDPLGRTLIAEINGQTRGVPFPPFGSWDFPLGSDRFGRDTFSRLLWAVRPTLMLVVIVGAIRLVLGVLIGMIAGWVTGPVGRILNTLIDAALTIPVLVVALAAITAFGIEVGLPAFIFGMALTGWAETAQTVRAQTQLIGVQPYIEAARAIGSNNAQILVRHLSRHITPLLGTLLAFEISATLMLTAALGFVGYFIGGGVWIITDGELIPQAERVSGLPELGQMIGSAEVGLSSRLPWDMIFPGTLIFLAILGFTLVGEGLRERQSLIAAPRNTFFNRVMSMFGASLEQRLSDIAGSWNRRATNGVYAALALIIVGVGGFAFLQANPGTQGDDPAAPAAVAGLEMPTGWAAERGDPYGTLNRGLSIDEETPNILWKFDDPTGLSGGPAVAEDGTIYLAGLGGQVHALSADGQPLWQTELAAEPVGSPALAEDGTIYVADRSGGLTAFQSDGSLSWHFQNTYRTEATSGPIVGPDGTIYFTVIDAVQAVAPDGQARWLGRDSDLPYMDLVLPRLSPDGKLVFLKNSAFSTSDGSLLKVAVVPNEPVFADPTIFVGGDGQTYYRSEHRIIPWRMVDAGIAIQPPLTWNATSTFFMPNDAGVTSTGEAWMLYTTDYADTRLVWIDKTGQLIGEQFFALQQSKAIAVANDGTVQICGSGRNRALECAAYRPDGGTEPVWELALNSPAGANPSGGAILDGRLYVASNRGTLYVLE